MDYEGEKFLLRLYRYLSINDSSLTNQEKCKYILNYIDRLRIQEKVFNGEHKNLENYLKKLYFDKYVIKSEDIDESYLNRKEKNKELIKLRIVYSQRKSLERWIDYLIKKDCPMWIKFWIFQSIIKLEELNKETWTFRKRSQKTVAPYIELDREALDKTIEDIIKYNENDNIDDQELNRLLGFANFKKIYAYNIKKLRDVDHDSYGVWVEYKSGDEEKVANSIVGKWTSWCITTPDMVKDYMSDKLIIYYTKDKDGNYTVPRICISKGKTIHEIRGVAPSQNIEGDMLPVLAKKIKEYKDCPNYWYIETQLRDMQRLNDIDIKTNNDEELTFDEIAFLFELEKKIQWFGNFPDYRIKTLRSLNLINDKEKAIDFLDKYSKYRDSIKCIGEELRKDKKFIIDELKINPGFICNIDNDLAFNEEFMKEAIRTNIHVLANADRKFIGNKNFMEEAIKINPLASHYAIPGIMDEQEKHRNKLFFFKK